MRLSYAIVALTAPALVFSAPLPVGRDRPAIIDDAVSPADDIFMCNPRNHNRIAMVYPMAWWKDHCYHPPEWYLDDPWSKIESENNEDFDQVTSVPPEEVINMPRSVMLTEEVQEVIESEGRPQEIEKRSEDDILALSPGSDPAHPFHYWGFWPPFYPKWKDPEWRAENCPAEGPCPAILKEYMYLAQAADVTPEEAVNTPGPVVPTEELPEVAELDSPHRLERRSDEVHQGPPDSIRDAPLLPFEKAKWRKIQDFLSKVNPGKVDLKELEKKYGHEALYGNLPWDKDLLVE